MHLDLNDLQTDVLIRELSQIVQNDRYPLSPRIVALKEILRQLRPEPEPEPMPRDDITSRRARGGIVGVDEAVPWTADDTRQRRGGQGSACGLVRSMWSPE